ncbi:50 kDa hatching enzyme [Aphelenchoides besseyi]|nr:50 kDa hatching enzyme [Aphelenchoides besseyi]
MISNYVALLLIYHLNFVALNANYFNVKPLANKKEVYDLRHDYVADSFNRRKRRYVLNKRKWSYDLLTWQLQIDNLNSADQFIIRNTLHRAFAIWSAVSSLRFIEIPVNQAIPSDIKIAFKRGKHDDNLPFDGPEGQIAHAFYPTIGVLHFDADEAWGLNDVGINLYQTAVHELGHLLGLEHSHDERAVMYPKNRKFDPHYSLSRDDIRAIERLYPSPKKNRFVEEEV